MDSYKHLSLAERVELKTGLARGESLRHLPDSHPRGDNYLDNFRNRH